MSVGEASLGDVCLAISSFRNDDAVLDVLSEVLASGSSPFARILVVDSLGTGGIPRAIAARNWEGVDYVSFDRNLGSAGNLAKRLELAGKTDARYVYATNHDGHVNLEVVRRLRSAAAERPSAGALFPLRRMSGRDGRYDVTGRFPVPLFAIRVAEKPSARTIRVTWSSSNGALYHLGPVRRGLLPWADLWMGWEDLGYGWLLEKEGYEQVLVVDAVNDDGYEYRRRGGMWVTSKPSWYAYYYARNFLLVASRTRQPLLLRAAVLGRVVSEFAVSLALRDDKRQRIAYLSAGLRDGLRGRAGKWVAP